MTVPAAGLPTWAQSPSSSAPSKDSIPYDQSHWAQVGEAMCVSVLDLFGHNCHSRIPGSSQGSLQRILGPGATRPQRKGSVNVMLQSVMPQINGLEDISSRECHCGNPSCCWAKGPPTNGATPASERQNRPSSSSTVRRQSSAGPSGALAGKSNAVKRVAAKAAAYSTAAVTVVQMQPRRAEPLPRPSSSARPGSKGSSQSGAAGGRIQRALSENSGRSGLSARNPQAPKHPPYLNPPPAAPSSRPNRIVKGRAPPIPMPPPRIVRRYVTRPTTSVPPRMEAESSRNGNIRRSAEMDPKTAIYL
eukprot:TRINITY_DN98713_c0_g1_i1.p1 TRINITY_DN98713_c0_g1~~TRINITY_DN98713_c0_g1_i1.p1  ORF type:complete len:334 (-),score=43.68 TRINITY_DN98713_c0_g1_i1:42-953(-)